MSDRRICEPEKTKYVLEQMVLESGADILYWTSGNTSRDSISSASTNDMIVELQMRGLDVDSIIVQLQEKRQSRLVCKKIFPAEREAGISFQ